MQKKNLIVFEIGISVFYLEGFNIFYFIYNIYLILTWSEVGY